MDKGEKRIMDLMTVTLLDQPLWMWGVFFAVVVVLLAFDLGVLNRRERDISVGSSLRLSAFYITMGLLFGLFVWHELGADDAQDYYTGFIIEKTLSLDNIFVISLIFSYFAVPRRNQYRVLFWGVLGVVILRGLLIFIGAELVHRFEWVLYLFAAFLLVTGIKMLLGGDEEPTIESNFILNFIKRHIRVTSEFHGQRFWVRLADAGGKKQLFATPLLVSLVVVEFVDLIFALDSVPAIFAVTTDEYIVYTSNIFAILGLRALYFALAAMLHRFEYLNYSLAAVLIFIGGKVFLPLTGMPKISSELSLLITLVIIGAGVVYSLAKTKSPKSDQNS
jgi:tellurite resistance protein TerC